MNILDTDSIPTMVVLAAGLSIALTCTTAGWPLRFIWCYFTRWTRPLWKMVRCPHCNSFWSGGLVAFLAGSSLAWCIAQAFITLAIVFVVQHTLLALGHDMTPDEDMDYIVGIKEK